MKSFKKYILDEAYSGANIVGLSTSDLGSVYKWLKWGNAAKTGLTEKDPSWAKQRDAIGSELGKRARGGEELAKRALNKRMDSSVDKYGKSIPAIRTPPTPNLLQKIAKALRGK